MMRRKPMNQWIKTFMSSGWENWTLTETETRLEMHSRSRRQATSTILRISNRRQGCKERWLKKYWVALNLTEWHWPQLLVWSWGKSQRSLQCLPPATRWGTSVSGILPVSALQRGWIQTTTPLRSSARSEVHVTWLKSPMATSIVIAMRVSRVGSALACVKNCKVRQMTFPFWHDW